MKGVIFNVFENFVVETFGEDVLEDIVADTTIETTEPFVGPGTYPAGDLVALVVTAAAKLGVTVDEALQACGRHAFPTLAGAVPSLMAHFDDLEAFLLGLESVVHTEVRKLDQDASPARFAVERIGDGELLMHYASPFGLFGLVHGLLDGAGDWFETEFTHEMVSSEGTNATFRIVLADGRTTQTPADGIPVDA
ncbi:MAG: heme NO-binding domain-containing protein [Acidimicrobiales bacterium]